MRRTGFWIALLTLLPIGRVSAVPAPLREATVIALHQGVNRIPAFMRDGRAATAILGWRDNGNAHGYSLLTIFVPSRDKQAIWNVVGVDHGNRFDDSITDSPHTGEDVVSTFRLVRAGAPGHRQIMLVVATRHWKDSIPEASPTTIEVFVFRRADGTPGTAPDYFARIFTASTKAKYCNADVALKQEAGLPLPEGYEGGVAPSGCL